MIFNGVEIYDCRFFTVNEQKKLQFYKGKYIGKTIDDFNSIEDLKKLIAYCFWLLQKDDVPITTKYCASYLLKSLFSKFSELEKQIKEKAIDSQTAAKKELEELIKTPGLKYNDKRRVGQTNA